MKIVSIKSVGVRPVYDLTVEKNQNFVLSNGILAHNCNSIQPALRGAIEEFSKNCSFIFTCNYKNRIIEPLHSRCSVIEFRTTKEDKPKFFLDGNNNTLYEILEYKDYSEDSIAIATKNEDCTISFILKFYNGGAHYTEVLEEALREIE